MLFCCATLPLLATVSLGCSCSLLFSVTNHVHPSITELLKGVHVVRSSAAVTFPFVSGPLFLGTLRDKFCLLLVPFSSALRAPGVEGALTLSCCHGSRILELPCVCCCKSSSKARLCFLKSSSRTNHLPLSSLRLFPGLLLDLSSCTTCL